jgi:DNA mismatch endonuclease (patch repair protein)
MPRQPEPPVLTTPERSRIMRAVRRRNTGPERLLQRGLRRLRLRFSKKSRDLPGSPDIVFRKSRVAVFVHGCFWHRHKGCPLATTPRSNIGYWRAKFAANMERDRRKVSELKRLGWKVIIVWQCEIEADADKAAQRVKSFLLRAEKARLGFGQSRSKPVRSS